MPERRSLVEHGTLPALYAHKRQREKPCEPCRLLRNERQRAWRARGNLCPKGHERTRQAGSRRICVECYQFDPSKCGTVAGRGQHERHSIPLCDLCKAFRRGENQRRYRRKTHCKCGLKLSQDVTGRGYCPPCRQRPRWFGEYRSLKSLAYTDKEIAKALGVKLEVLQKMESRNLGNVGNWSDRFR